MVFASSCKHASSAFIFASKSKFVSLKNNLADTVQPPAAHSQLCLVGDDVKLRHLDSRKLQCGTLGGHSKRSRLTLDFLKARFR